MKLLTTQKNALCKIIEENNLSPSQFDLNESEKKVGGFITRINFKASEFFFLIDDDFNSINLNYDVLYKVTFSPGIAMYVSEFNLKDWYTVQTCFLDWIKDLKKEIEAPNKWQRLENELANVNLNFKPDEDRFTYQEFEDIKQRIENLEERVSEIGLSPEQVIIINNKLEYLIDKAKEMSRFDWKSLFLGTIMSIIIQLNVSVENAKVLWKLIEENFKNVFLN